LLDLESYKAFLVDWRKHFAAHLNRFIASPKAPEEQA
jgi:hypothetical protein